jgi:hypothetical protein
LGDPPNKEGANLMEKMEQNKKELNPAQQTAIAEQKREADGEQPRIRTGLRAGSDPGASIYSNDIAVL